ncbi:DEAD/DEAH box helicase family protein [Sutcliffiella sp. BMC8]|uniref:DEAD/DEAH box helicase family protein n=2 Tax=unclassified Sutcliffiella TaxID=2837532 RepID=UPI0030CEF6FB
MRVSEKITFDEVRQWESGDIITIKAGTGAGKSHFIKNQLYGTAKENNKKILMLIHRVNCVNQFQDEIVKAKKTDSIDIKTYQYIDAVYKNNKEFDFSPYQYIVCDEFHYFMSDASFNKTTDMSLTAILKQKDKIRIFMSATGDYMERYISGYKKLETKGYDIPIKFNFIKDLRFFNKDETVEEFIKEAIKHKRKAIFFIQSAKKAFELYRKYQDYALFNCSKNNDEYYKFVDEVKITDMLKNERFEELVLITTTAMDAGVNIRDKELQHIVCDVKDIRTLIQCIGRKRLEDKKDGIYLHIKTITNQQLGGIETQLRKKIEMAQYLRQNSVHDYIKKYPREYDRWAIVYNDIVNDDKNISTLKINDLIYFKCLTDMNDIESMKRLGEFGYCKFLARRFGFYDGFDEYTYTTVEEKQKQQILEDYLESMVGKVLLTKSDRKELIKTVDVKQNGKLLQSLDSLNSALREQNIDYYIVQFETSRIVNAKKVKYKSAWKVMKLVDK